MKYEAYFKSHLKLIEKTLKRVLPPVEAFPHDLHEAMHYSVFPGGKRFRPVLTLAACEAAGGRIEDALLPAAALELIHCYSLVHDDLPALDNDEMRRGKPSCHKKFGEAMGILTGDALLNQAYHLLAAVQPSSKAVELLAEISTAAGSYGMIGGQVADLSASSGGLDLPRIDYISIHKTGKLIKASAVCGAIAAQADPKTRARLFKFGECLGLAFQVVDDLQDGDGYSRMMKTSEIRQKARDLIASAKREIKPLGSKAKKLQMLADFLAARIPKRNYVSVDK